MRITDALRLGKVIDSCCITYIYTENIFKSREHVASVFIQIDHIESSHYLFGYLATDIHTIDVQKLVGMRLDTARDWFYNQKVNQNTLIKLLKNEE